MKINTTTSLEYDLKKGAEEHNLSYSECLEFGILFKLAEMGKVDNYPDNSLSRKISNMAQLLQEAYKKIEELTSTEEDENIEGEAEPTPENINNELKEVFGNG